MSDELHVFGGFVKFNTRAKAQPVGFKQTSSLTKHLRLLVRLLCYILH